MAERPVAQPVADARQAVVDARREVEQELDALSSSARAAVDIPGKVRRNPVRTAGLGAGAAFLLLGGPRRVAKRVERQLFPKRRFRRLVPKDIDRAVDRLGEEEAEAARAHLERDFASYLERAHPKERANARRSLWATYDLLLGTVGRRAASELVKRLFEVPKDGPTARGEKDS
jgi:hypothetical protein